MMMRKMWAIALFSTCTVAYADIIFTPDYTDAPGAGFNDPTLGAARKTAFKYALDQWGGILKKSYNGETIKVTASFANLGNPLAIGGAAAVGYHQNFGAGVADTLYGSPLGNHLKKADLDGTKNEIFAAFNSTFADFYLGTDGNTPADKIDFVTLVMHEICHGLGFDSAIVKSDGKFKRGTTLPAVPLIFDRFLIDGTDTYLTAMNDAGRAAATTSGGLYFHGPSSGAGNAGNDFIQLHAPSIFEEGSSVAHLDAGAFPKHLMTPSQGDGKFFTIFGDAEGETRAILKDIGWDLAIPAPGTLVVLASMMVVPRRRR